MKIKREYLILIFISLIGVALRTYLFLDKTFIGIDAVAYTRLGKNLIESGKYVFGENFNLGIWLPPGYPILVGLINLFFDDLFLSGKIISLFFSIVSIFLFYLIGKELNNKEAGLFSAFAYAIYPTKIIERTLEVHTEGFFFCFLFFSIYLFIVLLKRNNFFIYILLGISIGISYLTRPEGLFLLLLPLLTLFKSNPLRNESNEKRVFKVCVTFVIFILIVSPYLLFLKQSTGRLTLSGKANTVILAGEEINLKSMKDYDRTMYSLNKDKTQLRAFELSRVSIINYIFKNPASFTKRFLKNVRSEMQYLSILLIPIMLPLFFSFFSEDLFKKKDRLILLLFSFLFGGLYSLFFVIERYMFPIALFLILFSSIGFVNSQSALSNILNFYKIKRNKITLFLEKHIKYIIIIVLILSSFLYYTVFRPEAEIPTEHIKTGYFLKNNISLGYEKLNIMSRMPWVSFYSDSRFTYLPYANYTDVVNFAKLYHVDYIVVDERLLSEWDYYDELFNMEKYSVDVKLIYEDNSRKLIKMFKVK